MKPKQFDELVRQKFDQNDFAYNPGNWEQLAEKLEGRAKKRSIIMWWWVPLAGMAASVIMAMGIAKLMRQPEPGMSVENTELSQARSFVQHEAEGQLGISTGTYNHKTRVAKYAPKAAGKLAAKDNTDWSGIQYQNAVGNNKPPAHTQSFNLMAEEEGLVAKNKKKDLLLQQPMSTFKPGDELKKAPKLSIILLGGYNHGNQNSGYMAGATVRRMVTDKVYVESDVALATTTNTQSTSYQYEVSAGSSPNVTAAKHAAKTSSAEGVINPKPTGPVYAIKDQAVSYNLYYAQVTPSIGYKLMKRMSIGLGPDFQQMLSDNRPAPSNVERNNIQEVPMFDIGFIGKTEYSLTKKVKAAVSYRKGVNSIISLNDKYIDRDYLQVQLKCVIFNK